MKKFVFSFFVLFLCSFLTKAQENLTYQKPSPEILKLVDYEKAPGVMMDEKKSCIVFTYQNTYKTLEDLNQEELQLGGLRINPLTNISSSVTYITNLKVRKILDQEAVQVSGLPANPKITYMTWSVDEKKIAFTNTTSKGIELWALDLESAVASRISAGPLNANLGKPYSWCNDSQHLLVRLIPGNRPAIIDSRKNLPAGPIISTSQGSKAQNRTYPDMLKNKTDEADFETLVTSELHLFDLSGQSGLYMEKAMYNGENFSPDGNYLMVTTLQKPFSYIVPLNRFPSRSVVFDKDKRGMCWCSFSRRASSQTIICAT